MWAIIDGCRRQLPAWQRILYEQYYRFAISVCIRYAANNDDAAEILNDGFVKIFKAIHAFTEPEDKTILPKMFMAWVKRIMINTGINYSKALARKISWTAADASLNNIASHTQTPVEAMGYDELIKMVQKLSPAYRNTFCLYAVDGYTHEEIAAALGISVGTSKSNLLKARRNLRKMLNTTNAEKV